MPNVYLNNKELKNLIVTLDYRLQNLEYEKEWEENELNEKEKIILKLIGFK